MERIDLSSSLYATKLATYSTTAHPVRTKDLFHLWSARSYLEKLPQETGGQQLPGAAVAPPSVSLQIVTVAILGSNATMIMWQVGNVRVKVILHTGSAISLVCRKEARLMNTHQESWGRYF